MYPLHARCIKRRPLWRRFQSVGVRVFGADEGGPVCLDGGDERVVWGAGEAPDGGEFGGVGYAEAVFGVLGGEYVPAGLMLVVVRGWEGNGLTDSCSLEFRHES
jgi:hypothetical protein